EIGFQPRLALEYRAVAQPGVGRDHNVLRWPFEEAARRRFATIADHDRAAGMRQSCRAADDDWRVESFGKLEGELREIERLLRIARLEHGHAGEHAIEPRVLLVLR